MKKIIFALGMMVAAFPASATELVLCQYPEKGPYVSAFSIPAQPTERVTARLYNGWGPPYKSDGNVTCEDPAQTPKNVTARCYVQYGPDGGQQLILQKSADGKYSARLTAQGPTGPGKSDTLSCE